MNKGFTLVELIVVIIIVGILASLGATQYAEVVEKGRSAEARMILGTLRSAEIAEFNENGAYVDYHEGNELAVSAPTRCKPTHFFYYVCTSNVTESVCAAHRCLNPSTGKTPNAKRGYYLMMDNVTGILTSNYYPI